MASLDAVINIIVNGQNQINSIINRTDQLQSIIESLSRSPIDLTFGNANRELDRFTREVRRVDQHLENLSNAANPIRQNIDAALQSVDRFQSGERRLASSTRVAVGAISRYRRIINELEEGGSGPSSRQLSIENLNAAFRRGLVTAADYGRFASELSDQFSELYTVENRLARATQLNTSSMRGLIENSDNLARARNRVIEISGDLEEVENRIATAGRTRASVEENRGTAEGFVRQIQFLNRLADSYTDLDASAMRTRGTLQDIPRDVSRAGVMSEISTFDTLASSVNYTTRAFDKFTIASETAKQKLGQIERRRVSVLAEAFSPTFQAGSQPIASEQSGISVSKTRREVEDLLRQTPVRSEAGLSLMINQLQELRALIPFVDENYGRLTTRIRELNDELNAATGRPDPLQRQITAEIGRQADLLDRVNRANLTIAQQEIVRGRLEEAGSAIQEGNVELARQQIRGLSGQITAMQSVNRQQETRNRLIQDELSLTAGRRRRIVLSDLPQEQKRSLLDRANAAQELLAAGELEEGKRIRKELDRDRFQSERNYRLTLSLAEARQAMIDKTFSLEQDLSRVQASGVEIAGELNKLVGIRNSLQGDNANINRQLISDQSILLDGVADFVSTEGKRIANINRANTLIDKQAKAEQDLITKGNVLKGIQGKYNDLKAKGLSFGKEEADLQALISQIDNNQYTANERNIKSLDTLIRKYASFAALKERDLGKTKNFGILGIDFIPVTGKLPGGRVVPGSPATRRPSAGVISGMGPMAAPVDRIRGAASPINAPEIKESQIRLSEQILENLVTLEKQRVSVSQERASVESIINNLKRTDLELSDDLLSRNNSSLKVISDFIKLQNTKLSNTRLQERLDEESRKQQAAWLKKPGPMAAPVDRIRGAASPIDAPEIKESQVRLAEQILENLVTLEKQRVDISQERASVESIVNNLKRTDLELSDDLLSRNNSSLKVVSDFVTLQNKRLSNTRLQKQLDEESRRQQEAWLKKPGPMAAPVDRITGPTSSIEEPKFMAGLARSAQLQLQQFTALQLSGLDVSKEIAGVEKIINDIQTNRIPLSERYRKSVEDALAAGMNYVRILKGQLSINETIVNTEADFINKRNDLNRILLKYNDLKKDGVQFGGEEVELQNIVNTLANENIAKTGQLTTELGRQVRKFQSFQALRVQEAVAAGTFTGTSTTPEKLEGQRNKLLQEAFSLRGSLDTLEKKGLDVATQRKELEQTITNLKSKQGQITENNLASIQGEFEGVRAIFDVLKTGVAELRSELVEIGKVGFEKTFSTFQESIRGARGFFGDLDPGKAIDKILDEFNKGNLAATDKDSGAAVAENIVTTFIKKIRAGLPGAKSASQAFAQAGTDAINEEWEIRSPSGFVIKWIENIINTTKASLASGKSAISAAFADAFDPRELLKSNLSSAFNFIAADLPGKQAPSFAERRKYAININRQVATSLSAEGGYFARFVNPRGRLSSYSKEAFPTEGMLTTPAAAAISAGQGNLRQEISDLFENISTGINAASGGGGAGLPPRPPVGFGGSPIDPDDEARSAVFAENEERAKKFLEASRRAEKSSTKELEAFAAGLKEVRSSLDPTAQNFKELSAQIDKTTGKLNRLIASRDPDADFLTRLGVGPKASAALAEGLIGGAFPLLFGQGLGASIGGGVGGAAGGFMGGSLGFGLSLIGTALGAAMDELGNKAIETGKSLRNPIEGFEQMKEANLFASKSQELYIQKLIESNNVTAASSAIQDEIIKKIGISGYNNLTRVSQASSNLNKAWADLNVQMQALLAGPLTGLLNWATEIAKRTGEGVRTATKIKDVREGLSEADRREFDKQMNEAYNKTLVSGGFLKPGSNSNLLKQYGEIADRFKSRSNLGAVQATELTPEQINQQQLKPYQDAVDILGKRLESVDLLKNYTNQLRDAAREQQDLDRQRFDLLKDYERSIADIRLSVERQIQQEVLANRQKENELFAAQGELRLQQLRNTNAELRSSQFGNEFGEQLADIVAQFTEKQLSTENEIANRRKNLELELEAKRIQTEQYRIDVAKQVSQLNLSTQKQIEQIQLSVLRKNQDYDRAKFNTEKTIAVTNLEIKRLEAQQAAKMLRGQLGTVQDPIQRISLEQQAAQQTLLANFIETQKNQIKSAQLPAPINFQPATVGSSVSTAGIESAAARGRELANQIESLRTEVDKLVQSGDIASINDSFMRLSDQGVKSLINRYEDLNSLLQGDTSTKTAIDRINKAFNDIMDSKTVQESPLREELVGLLGLYRLLSIKNKELAESLEFVTSKFENQLQKIDGLKEEINSSIAGLSEYEQTLLDLTLRGLSPASDEFKKIIKNAQEIDRLNQKIEVINGFKTAATELTVSLRGLVEQFFEVGSAAEAVKAFSQEFSKKALGFVLDIGFKPVEQAMQKTMLDLAGKLGFDIAPESLKQLQEVSAIRALVQSIETQIRRLTTEKVETIFRQEDNIVFRIGSTDLGAFLPASVSALGAQGQVELNDIIRQLIDAKKITELQAPYVMEKLKQEILKVAPTFGQVDLQTPSSQMGGVMESRIFRDQYGNRVLPSQPINRSAQPTDRSADSYKEIDKWVGGGRGGSNDQMPARREVFPVPESHPYPDPSNGEAVREAIKLQTIPMSDIKALTDGVKDVGSAAAEAQNPLQQFNYSLNEATGMAEKFAVNFTENGKQLNIVVPQWGKNLGAAVTGLSLASTAVIGIAGGIQNIKAGGTGNVLTGIGSILTTIGGIGMSAAGMGLFGGGANPGSSVFKLAPNQFGSSSVNSTFGSANGNIFDDGELMRFANGGILQSPTLFSFEDAGIPRRGQAGEAGPEAVMPLKRTKDGRLGVEAELSIPFEGESDERDETEERDGFGAATGLPVPFVRAGGRTGSMTAAQMLQAAAEAGLTVPFAKEGAASEPDLASLDSPIRFETFQIGELDVVTRKEAEEIGRRAEARGATKGAAIAQKRLQNNPNVRRSVGI